jgi:hypothetical protein
MFSLFKSDVIFFSTLLLDTNGENNNTLYTFNIKVFVNISENSIHLKFSDLVINSSIFKKTYEIAENISHEANIFPKIQAMMVLKRLSLFPQQHKPVILFQQNQKK